MSVSRREYGPNNSTRETVVEDLWREGWFMGMAKSVARGVTTLDADDMAVEAAITGQRAAEAWTGEGELVAWVKWRCRNHMLTIRQRHAEKLNRASDKSIYDTVDDGDMPLIDVLGFSTPSADVMVESLTWDDVSVAIEKALSELTPNQRQYVELRFFQDGNKFSDGHVSYKHLTGAWPGAAKKLRASLGDFAWLVAA